MDEEEGEHRDRALGRPASSGVPGGSGGEAVMVGGGGGGVVPRWSGGCPSGRQKEPGRWWEDGEVQWSGRPRGRRQDRGRWWVEVGSGTGRR